MTIILDSCGKRLRYLRKISRLSRTQLSYKYEISANSLKFWESSDKELGEHVINKLMEIYKDQGIIFNRDWIIYGTGELPKSLSKVKESIVTSSSLDTKDINFEIKSKQDLSINNDIENIAILKEINCFKDIYPDHAILKVNQEAG